MFGQQDKQTFTVKEVPAQQFIHYYADYLKKNNKLKMPNWVDFVKTSKGISSSTACQLAPLDPDWLYIRVAALARKIYIRPKTGVGILSHFYGRKFRPGVSVPKHQNGGQKIIRWALVQLQEMKILKKMKKNDKHVDRLKINCRIVTKQGKKELTNIATQMMKNKLGIEN